MATFDPDVELLRTQIESLRAQTDRRWLCLISDDCSAQDRYEAIEAAVGRDPRFVLSRSARRRGFYRNFERALRMLPPEAELVALCDQDDRWYPDKLETLRGAIRGVELAYSDLRLVDPHGGVLAESLWERRPHRRPELISLLRANTIPGAASLFRRRVVDYALPFPEGPGWQFHDHWLGVTAAAIGDVAYVDRPLYDYVQHPGAVLRGRIAGGADPPANASDENRRDKRDLSPRRVISRWRAAYFYAYQPLALRAHVLLERCAARLTRRKRRALRRLIAAGSLAVRVAVACERRAARRLDPLRDPRRGGHCCAERSCGATWSPPARLAAPGPLEAPPTRVRPRSTHGCSSQHAACAP